jgi:hypothetical protein
MALRSNTASRSNARPGPTNPPEWGLSLYFDVVDYTVANQRQNRRENYTQNRVIPQSLRLISALMTAIEKERRALCAGVLSRFYCGSKTPAVTAE